jgi:hypothetical protein
VQEEAAGDPPQHVLFSLRKQNRVQNGSYFFKGSGLRTATLYKQQN